MAIVSLLLIIVLGLLGVASWLKARQPAANAQLSKLESIEGWVGLVGLIWGIIMLLQTLSILSAIGSAPLAVLIALASVIVVIALSLILALPVVRQLLGANGFTNKLAEAAGKLMPFKVALGFVCLGLAGLSVLGLLGIHIV
jgi:hypothetical protein